MDLGGNNDYGYVVRDDGVIILFATEAEAAEWLSENVSED